MASVTQKGFSSLKCNKRNTPTCNCYIFIDTVDCLKHCYQNIYMFFIVYGVIVSIND